MPEDIIRLDKEDLRELIAEIIDVPVTDVGDDVHFVQDLEVDSLMALEITVRMEKRYGVRLADTELAEVATLASTYELLDGKLRAAS
jgi:acyl carrier protein